MIYKAEIFGFVALGLFIALLIGVCIFRWKKRRQEATANQAKEAINGEMSTVPTPQIVVTTPASPTPNYI